MNALVDALFDVGFDFFLTVFETDKFFFYTYTFAIFESVSSTSGVKRRLLVKLLFSSIVS